jgi:hypothetical protein
VGVRGEVYCGGGEGRGQGTWARDVHHLVVVDEVCQRLELARLVHQVGPPAEAQRTDAAAVAHREHDVAVAMPVDLRVEDERQPVDVWSTVSKVGLLLLLLLRDWKRGKEHLKWARTWHTLSEVDTQINCLHTFDWEGFLDHSFGDFKNSEE